MSTERDNLAAVITKAYVEKNEGARYTGGHAPVDEPIADAILAAGYRKPRIITTAEELDALPTRTVILSDSGTIAARYDSTAGVLFGMEGSFPWRKLALPATVLWEPK